MDVGNRVCVNSACDEFDAVVNLDEQWYQEGLRDGKEAGTSRAKEEGRQVGLAKGVETGAEVGFMAACCRVALATVEENRDAHIRERASKALEGVLRMAEDFTTENTQDVDIVEALQRLRAKFKATMSLLSAPMPFELRPQGQDTMDF